MTVRNKIYIYFILFSSVVSNSQNDFDLANKEYLKGNFNEAIKLYTKSIESKKEISKSYMMRGATKGMMNEFAGALLDLDTSVRLDSLYYKVYFYYGRTYMIKGLPYTAIKYFNKALKLSPQEADVYDDRALAKIEIKDYEGAIIDEDNAIKINGYSSAYYTARGWAKHKLKMYEAAIKDFDLSLKIQNDAQTFADRGLSYYELKMYQKAIEDYSKAIAIEPKGKDVYYSRGLAYKSMGKINEACLDFSTSSELNYEPAKIELKNNCTTQKNN